MKNSRTKKLLALLAVGAVMTTAAAGITFSRNVAPVFASADAVAEETAPAGSEKNPVVANEGENTIDKLLVRENPEMGIKELVYYMTFTPAQSGEYTLTHSNPDIVVDNVYSDVDAPYGEWNDDWTVQTIELSANVKYTLFVIDYDWEIDLSGYEVNSYYAIDPAVTINIAYKGAAAGSTQDTALDYTVGESIYVPQGHAPVWYTFTGNSAVNYYVIVNGGSATVKRGPLTNTIINGYKQYTGSGKFYICATPTDDEAAEITVLVANEQTEGSCIVTAKELPADGVVGEDNWYTYTVGDKDVTVSLTPTADAPVIETQELDEEGEVITVEKAISGYVYVYNGYTYEEILYDGSESITLKAGTTYHFFAPAYVYEEWNDEGEIVLSVNVNSKLVIG